MPAFIFQKRKLRLCKDKKGWADLDFSDPVCFMPLFLQVWSSDGSIGHPGSSLEIRNLKLRPSESGPTF